MKSTGMIRRIDHLGRIVIPKEIRNTFDIESGTPLELCVDENNIIFRKFAMSCTVCGNEDVNLYHFKKAMLCKNCFDKLKE